MKHFQIFFRGQGLIPAVVFCVLLIVASPARAGEESAAVLDEKGFAPQISYRSYSNLSELVTFICDDSGDVFRDFYAPGKVAVSPFTVISDYKVHKMTMLGITLADQMTAMINSRPAAEYFVEHSSEQNMEGVIEEMDGFLRVHVSGINVLGERRGHVVNVEMSEPIYRFLHSYVESY